MENGRINFFHSIHRIILVEGGGWLSARSPPTRPPDSSGRSHKASESHAPSTWLSKGPRTSRRWPECRTGRGRCIGERLLALTALWFHEIESGAARHSRHNRLRNRTEWSPDRSTPVAI